MIENLTINNKKSNDLFSLRNSFIFAVPLLIISLYLIKLIQSFKNDEISKKAFVIWMIVILSILVIISGIILWVINFFAKNERELNRISEGLKNQIEAQIKKEFHRSDLIKKYIEENVLNLILPEEFTRLILSLENNGFQITVNNETIILDEFEKENLRKSIILKAAFSGIRLFDNNGNFNPLRMNISQINLRNSSIIDESLNDKELEEQSNWLKKQIKDCLMISISNDPDNYDVKKLTDLRNALKDKKIINDNHSMLNFYVMKFYVEKCHKRGNKIIDEIFEKVVLSALYEFLIESLKELKEKNYNIKFDEENIKNFFNKDKFDQEIVLSIEISEPIVNEMSKAEYVRKKRLENLEKNN
jgi:hypothetical protein